jgi:hypothetical protein
MADLSPDLCGPSQNRWGGHKTQRIKTFPGSQFSLAGPVRHFSSGEIEDFVKQNLELLNPASGKSTDD